MNYDDDHYYEDDDCNFFDPNSNSALRAGTRDQSCPTCGTENCMTAEDIGRGYQCDSCANAAERGW